MWLVTFTAIHSYIWITQKYKKQKYTNTLVWKCKYVFEKNSARIPISQQHNGEIEYWSQCHTPFLNMEGSKAFAWNKYFLIKKMLIFFTTWCVRTFHYFIQIDFHCAIWKDCRYYFWFVSSTLFLFLTGFQFIFVIFKYCSFFHLLIFFVPEWMRWMSQTW